MEFEWLNLCIFNNTVIQIYSVTLGVAVRGPGGKPPGRFISARWVHSATRLRYKFSPHWLCALHMCTRGCVDVREPPMRRPWKPAGYATTIPIATPQNQPTCTQLLSSSYCWFSLFSFCSFSFPFLRGSSLIHTAQHTYTI